MSDGSSFLYPFLDQSERNAGALLDDLERSAAAKWEASTRLRSVTLSALSTQITATAAGMAARFAAGGALLTFGNGGSATDATAAAELFAAAPGGRPLPARSLADDAAVLTALANDIGTEAIFARQLIAAARPGDIVLGLSTSGSSANILAAFAEARRRRCITVGIAGYDGGAMAASGDIDECLVVRSDSVHRIQEVQTAVIIELWRAVQRATGEPAA